LLLKREGSGRWENNFYILHEYTITVPCSVSRKQVMSVIARSVRSQGLQVYTTLRSIINVINDFICTPMLFVSVDKKSTILKKKIPAKT